MENITSVSHICTKPDCRSCMYGTSMVVNGDILCRIKGVVSKDHVCRKYKRSPFQISNITKVLHDTCADCKFFNRESNDNDEFRKLMDSDYPEIGLCSLFSVRKYDGLKRRACSKFVSKDTLEVS